MSIIRALVGLFLVPAFFVLGAKPAFAHSDDTSSASNWLSTVDEVIPASPMLHVEVLQGGNAIRLDNSSDQPVTVPIPEESPVLIEPGEMATWVDHRVHWMESELPSRVQAEPDKHHVVSQWIIELRHGNDRVQVMGHLEWSPAPPLWSYLATAAGLALIAILAGHIRRWRMPVTAVLTLLISSALVHLLITDFPLQLGSLAGIFDTVWDAVPVLVSVPIGMWALRALWQERASSPYILALASAILVVSGLSDLNALTHSQLFSRGPDWLARSCVMATLGLGTGLIYAAWRLWHREQPLPPAHITPAVKARL